MDAKDRRPWAVEPLWPAAESARGDKKRLSTDGYAQRQCLNHGQDQYHPRRVSASEDRLAPLSSSNVEREPS